MTADVEVSESMAGLHDKDAALEQAALTTACRCLPYRPHAFLAVVDPPARASGAGALVCRRCLVRLAGGAIPLYGWVAIAGGVLISLLVGGGLMALVFYSAATATTI